MNLALELEAQPGVLSASVFSVQPWLDLPEVGSSVIVVTDGDRSLAQQEAARLARELWNRREAFEPDLTPYEEAIDEALASDGRPFVFSDSSDAPSSGAPGDSTVLLSALLDRNVQDPIYLNIVDSAAVARAEEVGVGNTGSVTVGASLTDQFYSPVSFDGTVRTLFDGRFRFKGPGFNGVTFNMGKTAVWVAGGIHLVTMERGILQWDPELYRCVGLEPADARIVMAKSPAAFRAAYSELAHTIVNVDAPGVCSPNLRSFPWRRISRPIYPLDEFEPSHAFGSGE
jgi:microcystin degradation protein MlrC